MSPEQITPKMFLKKEKKKSWNLIPHFLTKANQVLHAGEPGIKEHILAGDERGVVGGMSLVVVANKSLSRQLTATRSASHLNVHQAKEEHLIEEM